MYNTTVPHVNVMKKLRWEGIQVCGIFVRILFSFGRVEASREVGWCSVRKGGCPGAWILLFLIQWTYAAMDFSDWSHVEMVRWWYRVNVLFCKIVSPQGNLLLWLTQPEITRQIYRRLCKYVVTLKCSFLRTNHNLKTNNFRQIFLTM